MATAPALDESVLSLMEKIALMPEAEREIAIAKIAPTQEDRARLRYMWPLWARPKQLPPPGDWLTWVMMSGRGFGKTRAGAEWVLERAEQGYGPIALVAQTKADARDTMIEIGESSILQVCDPAKRPRYEPSKRRLTWPNGVTATVYSGDEPGQLRGPQHASVWVDELAKFKYPQETWDNMLFGLRVGDDPKVIVTTTPRPIKTMREIINDDSTVLTRGSSYENIGNLSPIYVDKVLGKYAGTRLGRQELYGEILDDVMGALWHQNDIEQCRVSQAPELWRIGVGIDPKASTNANSETGIIVAGLARDGHAYVLDDVSIDGTPAQWALAAIAAYNRNQADFIVAEVNNGGDMVQHTIKNARDGRDNPIGKGLPVINVHASRGKAVRAEPISLFYEQGKVHHVGQFAELEDQLINWVPKESPSPDRLDALVWVLSTLMIELPKVGRKRRARAR